MIPGAVIGVGDTLVPLVALGALAVVLPWLFTPRATRSQARLAGGVALAALAVLIAAGALLAGLADGFAQAFAVNPLHGALSLIERAAMTGIFWGPLMALVWLGLAQRVEKRRGEDKVRGT